MTRRTGLLLPNDLSIDRWRKVGEQIALISDASSWWLGDWLVFGQDKYPDRYLVALERTGLEYKTLKNYAWVARRVDRSRRRDLLSFQHHAEVASLPADEQDCWLSKAAEQGWSRHEMRLQMRALRGGVARAPAAHTLVALQPGAERAARWQEAAKQAQCELTDWIVSILDHAAEAALEMAGTSHEP